MAEGVRDYARQKVAVEQYLPDVVVLALPLQDMDDPLHLLELRRSQPDLAFAFLVDSDDQVRPWSACSPMPPWPLSHLTCRGQTCR